MRHLWRLLPATLHLWLGRHLLWHLLLLLNLHLLLAGLVHRRLCNLQHLLLWWLLRLL